MIEVDKSGHTTTLGNGEIYKDRNKKIKLVALENKDNNGVVAIEINDEKIFFHSKKHEINVPGLGIKIRMLTDQTILPSHQKPEN